MKFSVVDGRIFNPGDLSWDGFRALKRSRPWRR